MTRQNQFQNLMKLVKKNGIIDTNTGQKEYILLYHEPIQIGTRLGDLCRSGYLHSVPTKKKSHMWVLTDSGERRDGEHLIIKNYYKTKKTKAEREIKSENKVLNTTMIETPAPKLQSTSLLGRVRSLLS